jgi:flagellin-like protein
MSDDSRLIQQRLLLLIQRGAWPYYAAIILIAFVIWLIHAM